MTIQQLKYVIKTVECGSITAVSYTHLLKLVPQKEGIISKRFTGQKITPYIDLREQSLYYTVKKTVIFRLQRETL